MRACESIHDAFELGLILGIDFRPQHRARGGAEKFPVALRDVSHLQADGSERVANFRREKIAVLVADIVGRAFEVDVNPAPAFEAVRFREGGVVSRRGLRIFLGSCGASERLRRCFDDCSPAHNQKLCRENRKSQQHQDEWQTIAIGSHRQNSLMEGLRDAMLGVEGARCKRRERRDSCLVTRNS